MPVTRCSVFHAIAAARRLAVLVAAALLPGTGGAADPQSLTIGFAELGERISAMSSEAPVEALDVAFPALQQAHLVVENLKQELAAQLGKPFRTLSVKQQAHYHQAAAMVDRLTRVEQSREGWIRLRREIESTAADVLDNVGAPAIFSYEPAIIAPQPKGVVVVEVIGSGLAKGEAVVDFGGVTLLSSANDRNRLSFELPAGEIEPEETQVTAVAAQLSLSRKKKPLVIVDVFGGTKTASFRLLFFVLPRLAWTYQLSAPGGKSAVETQEMRSDPITVESDSAIGRTQTCKKLDLDEPGWEIDPESIRWESTLEQNGQFVRVQQDADGSPCLLFTVYGRGVALGPGRIRGHATYSASRQRAGDSFQEVAEGAIEWGQQVAVPLPEESSKFKLETTLFDGSKLVIEEPGEFGLVEVERDGPQRLLIRSEKPQL